MRNFEDVRRYLADKPGATEEYPFDAITLVLKVGGKMFALIATDKVPLRVNLKCDPNEAEALRAEFPAIQPGYHMNKTHWNTVTLDGTIPQGRVREMMDDSYALVVQTLKKTDREALVSRR
jgi:predicted DNA-binding protein (MmcQ/YjbR family)